tara:strand:- start:341 stop:841 length:501 start_codon:yes stop_codon:yes gene_type:complete
MKEHTNKINEQIVSDPVDLIYADGKRAGITSLRDAMQMALEEELDLVEVSPSNNGEAPVCKILNFGKWLYNQKKHKKQHHDHRPKEVRVGVLTSDHDLHRKVQQVSDFLLKRHQVRYTMRLKGGRSLGVEEVLNRFESQLEAFSDSAVWDSPSVSGKAITVVLKPS